MCIVALGVAFFVGVKSSSPIMAYNVDKYFKEYNVSDMTIYSDYGFDNKDVESIKKLDYVDKVVPYNFVDVLTNINDDTYIFRVETLPTDINKFILLEGRLPNNTNEVLVERSVFYFKDLKLNDELKLERPDGDLSDFLINDTYKVVGFITSAYYMNQDIGVSTLDGRFLSSYVYVLEDCFDFDYFTGLSLTYKKDLNRNDFTKQYFDESKNLKEDLEKFGLTQINNRKETVLTKADEKFNEGQQEYNDGLKEYDEKISDAQKEIDDAKDKIKKGEKDIKDGYKTLSDKEKEVEEKLINGANEITAKRNELGVSETTLVQSKNEFESKKAEASASLSKIEDGINQYNQGINQAKTGSDSLNGAIGLIDSNIQSINLQIQSLDKNDPNYQVTLATLLATIQGLEASKQTYQAQLNGVNATISDLENKRNDLVNKKNEINAQLQEGQSKLDSATNQIAYGWQALTNASVELDNARKEADIEFKKARNELEDAKIKLEDAKVKLSDGETKLEDAKTDGLKKIEDAKEKLEKAKQDIEKLKDGKWTVLDRSQNYTSKSFFDTVNQMKAIGDIFPLFFFLVASLVCLTTMSRMVDEQRGQIGIYRALGYSESKIYLKYFVYAISSTLIGGLLGSIIGLLIFPSVIYNVWKLMYNLPAYNFIIPWDLIAQANIGFILVMLLTTYYACKKDIKEVPSQLLRPKVPNSGKSIGIDKIKPLWDKFDFSTKLTIRNIVRYKKRFFMTVIGISGCTALMITGFGIKDSISSIIQNQFFTVFKFDASLSLDNDLTVSESNNVYKVVSSNENIQKSIFIGAYNSEMYKDDKKEGISINVFKDGASLNEYFNTKKRLTNIKVPLTNSGVLINEKLALLYDIKVGDKIKIESQNELIKEVVVDGIFENYVNHYVILSEDYYKHVFGNTVKKDTILLKSNSNTDIKHLQNELSNLKEIKSVSFFYKTVETFSDMFKGLNSIVYVIVISSGLLAFVVLSNLTNVNISERERELATFKVLGFTQKEINMFIYKENMVLTLIGSLLGIPLGILLHRYLILLVEFDFVMFGRNVHFISFVIAIVLTLLFSMVVNFFMAKKLNKIQMVESLKSVE